MNSGPVFQISIAQSSSRQGQKIIGEIFEEGAKLDEAIDSIENCSYQSSTLLNLINDLLDLAKLEKMQF